MANSGPGWEGIELGWGEMVRRRNAEQDRVFREAAEEAEAAVAAAPDEDVPPPP